MKKVILVLLLFINTAVVFSQKNPVKWSSNIEYINTKEAYIVFTAEIRPSWHLYNITVPDGGPIATTFTIKNNNNFDLIGDVFSEDKPVKSHDRSFNMLLEYYTNRVSFKQKIKIIKDSNINVSVRFMCCDDHQCIPPTEHKFKIVPKR